MQCQVREPAFIRPLTCRGDKRAPDAPASGAPGDGEFADVPVPLAGEVPDGPDADHPGDPLPRRPVPRDRDEDGAIAASRGAEGVLQPALPGLPRFRLVAPGRDAFGQPRGKRQNRRTVTPHGGPDIHF
jgi:hypothetical protein